MNAGAVLHHYNLTTGHVAKTPRSDVSSKTLTLLRPVIERAVGGYAVTLPGFHDHRLSIRNIWHGAVGWLIEGAERRVMVRCVSAWTVTGVTKGLTWLSADAVLGVTKGLTWLSADAVLLGELRLPCCLVQPGVSLLADPDAGSRLNDAERCISWMLFDGNGPNSGPEAA